MPLDINKDCFVLYNGKIQDVEYPVYILRDNHVSLAYTDGKVNTAWFYDAENDILKNRRMLHGGFASTFINLTGLQNHTTLNMFAGVLTKEMVTLKAIPFSGQNNLNYIEDELTDI